MIWIVILVGSALLTWAIRNAIVGEIARQKKIHKHEFKTAMVGRATITHSWFGGKWETQQEVIATMLVCSCGEKKATIEGIDGKVREINPMFLDMDYRNGISMCASGVRE